MAALAWILLLHDCIVLNLIEEVRQSEREGGGPGDRSGEPRQRRAAARAAAAGGGDCLNMAGSLYFK